MTARRPTRLPRWHEWSIYAGFALLVTTGVAWLVLDRWVRIAGEFGPEHHPAERLMLTLHGIGAYLLLIVAGALIPVHVKLGWSVRRNLATGIAVAAGLVLLGLTGLGLYYLSGEGARGLTSIVHWVVGLAATPILLVHALRGRAGAIARRARPQRSPDWPKPGS